MTMLLIGYCGSVLSKFLPQIIHQNPTIMNPRTKNISRMPKTDISAAAVRGPIKYATRKDVLNIAMFSIIFPFLPRAFKSISFSGSIIAAPIDAEKKKNTIE